MIAYLVDGFQRHLTGTLNSPFVVLPKDYRADEADDGAVVREDADDLLAALDLAVEAFAEFVLCRLALCAFRTFM
jgi:hypothetical protein